MHFSNISLQQEQTYIFNSFRNLDNASFFAFYVYLLFCLFFFSVHILFFLIKLHFVAFLFCFRSTLSITFSHFSNFTYFFEHPFDSVKCPQLNLIYIFVCLSLLSPSVHCCF